MEEKMRLLYVALIGLFFTSCAALEPPKRWTEDNIFYSSKSPSLQIDVPDEFIYIGEFDGDYMAGKSLDPSIKTHTKRVLYNFGVIGENKRLLKLYQINIETLPIDQYWTPWSIKDSMLMHGMLKQGDENYPYAVVNRSHIGNLTSQYLLDKGIITPSCVLSLSATRRYGSNNNVRMHINYMEDVSSYSEYDIESCSDWNKLPLFNDKQKNFIKKFEERAKEAIQLSPYTSPMKAK
jgi:hypothetical protein